jgi:hypothetical protein
VDEAMYYFPRIEAILRQQKTDRTDLATCYRLLAEALQAPAAAPMPAPEPQRR